MNRTDARSEAIPLMQPDTWPDAANLGLEERQAEAYRRKLAALRMWASGSATTLIHRSTGISRQMLRYLISRAVTLDRLGQPLGHRALVGHAVRLRARYTTPAESQRVRAGAFLGLLQQYPALARDLRAIVFPKKRTFEAMRMERCAWTSLHRAFLDLCEKYGIRPPAYPFCTASRGLPALRHWITQQQADAARIDPVPESPRGIHTLAPQSLLERVECDGQYLDVSWSVSMPGLAGEGALRLDVDRLWLICLTTTRGGPVLGYSVAFGRHNYCASDVARAVRSALVPWTPRRAAGVGDLYRPGDGLPSGLGPSLRYLCFDEIWLDNGLANQGQLAMGIVRQVVNATAVWGPVATPDARPAIEGLFRILDDAGFRQTSASLGRGPADPRRAKGVPRRVLPLDALLYAVDLLVARFNGSRAPGTSLTRNQLIQDAVQRSPQLIRRVPQARRRWIDRFDLYEHAKIGEDKGACVLRWRNARYSGPGLLHRRDLLGKAVLVMAYSLDLRAIHAVVLDSSGESLGDLMVEPRWRARAHSLWARTQERREMSYHSFMAENAEVPSLLELMAINRAPMKRVRDAVSRLQAETVLAEPVSSTDALPRQDHIRSKRHSKPPLEADPASADTADLAQQLLQLGPTYS